jgi:hypothetical protein
MTGSRPPRGLTALVVLATALLGSCSSQSAAQTEESGPAHVEPVGDLGLHRITLEAQAVTRLDLQTGHVRGSTADGAAHLLVAHSAVVYDAEGAAWVYTVVDDLTYQRAPVEIDRVVAEDAALLSGPPVRTEVVTVGAAELYGAEHDVGH